METELLLPALFAGALFAAMLGSMFGVGAGLVVLLFLSNLYPMSVVVPLVPACLVGIELVRAARFYQHITWRIVRPFILGAVVGTLLGSGLYFSIPNWLIALLISFIILLVLWLPALKLDIKAKHPYFYLGVIHSFISTLFAVGGLFQAVMARLNLPKLQIIATIAISFCFLTLMKVIGYSTFGFDYLPYLKEILVTLVAAIPGTLIGAKLVSYISDSRFNVVFKVILTFFALRLLYISFINYPG